MTFKDGTKSEKYTIPFGVILPLSMALLFWMKSNDNSLIFIGAIIFSYITVSRLVYAWQSILVAPRIVEIEADSITVEMLYRKKNRFRMSEIKRITGISWLQIVTLDRTIVLVFSNCKYLIFSKEFENLGDILRLIKAQNPTCEIDGRLQRIIESKE